MLAVELNRANYEYDVHSLVKAFYPEEQVSVLTSEMGEAKRESLKADIRIRILLEECGASVRVDGADYHWDFTENQEFKYGFKCFLYRVLSQATGRTLPWGNLTGIRPTKIAYQLLEEGKSGREIVEYYREKYYVSAEKAELSVDIARRERALIRTVSHHGKGGEDNGYSLYIGIPFCPTTCLYCSFTSFPVSGYRKLVDAYVDCLIRELEYAAECCRGKILDTVYVGGGTPTTLEPEQMDRLLARLKALFDFSTVKEFTVEAGRADSITEAKLQVLRKHGVSRISINPQTMNQETLDYIGRRASVEQVQQAYDQIMKEKQQGYTYGRNQTYGGYSRSSANDSIPLQAAANYIANRHFEEALHALGSISSEERNARWYFYSAMANAGLGRNVTAKEHIDRAVMLEPSNMEYRQFKQHIEFGGTWYQYMGRGYERPYAGTGNWCLSMLFLNMLCQCCCFRPC